MARQRIGERGGEFRPSLNRCLYLVCVLIGLVLMAMGSGYKTPNVGLVGPALVPILVGGLLVLLPLVTIVAASLGGSRSPAGGAEESETSLPRSAALRLAALLGISAFFALGLEFLGFPVTASLSAFAAIVVLGGRPVVAALMAIVLPALLWVGFVELLGLTLPVGDLFYSLLYS